MSGLRTRCAAFLTGRLKRPPFPPDVDALVEFVVSEVGRSAHTKLETTLPLCLYFASDADRDEFIAAVREAKPNMIMRKI